jgi:histidinol-phosphatase (PHP family)
MSVGGRFTLSDDSHGVAQVGTNYPRLLEFIKKAGIKEIWCADRKPENISDARFRAGYSSISVEALERHPYWAAT